MRKIVVLILLLFSVTGIESAFCQQNNGILFELTPGVIIPLGGSADHYGIGISADLNGTYSFPSIPSLFVLGSLGVEQCSNILTDKGLSLISLSAGAGLTFSPFNRLRAETSVSGGYYLGVYNNEIGGSALLKGNMNFSFKFSSSFSLGLFGAYHHYLSGTDPFFQGFQTGLSVFFNPAGGKGKSKIKIKDIHFEQIFPVFQTYYAKHPIGTVTIENKEAGSIEDISISFFADEYMSNSTPGLKIDNIPRNEERTIPLFALFGKNILNVTEGTEASAEIIIKYTLSGTEVSTQQSCILPIQRRNAMTWEDDERAASFVTAFDPAVLRFAKPIASTVLERDTSGLNDNFRKAFAIFHGLSMYKIRYIVDPTTPYEELSENKFSIDFLQFPNETLTYKSGDCDDLSIMYAALLESVNIDTAFITVPGHIYIAFAMDIPPEEGKKTFSDSSGLIFRNGNTWIPVEITMMSEDFLQAWDYGAKEWNKNEADGKTGFFPLSEAWKTYHPVDSPFKNTDIKVPDADMVFDSYKTEFQSFIRRDIEERKVFLQKKIQQNNNPRYINRLGVLYARYGLMEDASKYFKQGAEKKYVPSITNLGNIAYMAGDFNSALSYFTQADRLSPDKANILLGLARTNYELENYGMVKQNYLDLKELNPGLAENFSYLVSATDETARAGSVKERRSPSWSEE